MGTDRLERTPEPEGPAPYPFAGRPNTLDSTNWEEVFKRIAENSPSQTDPPEVALRQASHMSTVDIVRSPIIAAAIKWQSRERRESSRFGRFAARLAIVGGLTTAATALLTMSARAAQAYAMTRHGIDLGVHHDQPILDTTMTAPAATSAEAPMLDPHAPPSNDSDLHLVHKAGMAFYISDTESDHHTTVASNENTNLPDDTTIVAKQELAKIAYRENMDSTDAIAFVNNKDALHDVEVAFIKDNDITAPDGQLVAGQSYEVDAADDAAHHEFTQFAIKHDLYDHSSGDNDTDTSESGSKDKSSRNEYVFDNNEAEIIRRNEGWHAQFHQMGIEGSNRQLHRLLSEVGPELRDRGVAYWDHRHGGFWGMRLVEPDSDGSGYRHDRHAPGHIRDKDLDYIMRAAERRGLLDDTDVDTTTSNDNGTTDNNTANNDETAEHKPTAILPEPNPTSRPTTVQQLAEQHLIRMGITDEAAQTKVANEVASDPALLAELRQEGVIPAQGTTLNTSALQRVGDTLVLPADVRDDFYNSVNRNLIDDLPVYQEEIAKVKASAEAAARNTTQEAEQEVEGFWADVQRDWAHLFDMRNINMAENWNWAKALGLAGVLAVMYRDEYVMKPRYYRQRTGTNYIAPGLRVGEIRQPNQWRNWARRSPTPYPMPWAWNRVTPTPTSPVSPVQSGSSLS